MLINHKNKTGIVFKHYYYSILKKTIYLKQFISYSPHTVLMIAYELEGQTIKITICFFANADCQT